MVHTGDFAATVRGLAEEEPVAVLAGIEIGVELADELSEALGLRTNGTALSPAWRDEYRMVEAVRPAGLRAAHQLTTADESELLAWYAKLCEEGPLGGPHRPQLDWTADAYTDPDRFRARMSVSPGGPIIRSVNDLTDPMLVDLLHPVQENVLRDYGTVRYLDPLPRLVVSAACHGSDHVRGTS